MKKLISILVFLFAFLPFTHAQNYTTVTATMIGDASGTGGLLQSGTICFQPVNASLHPTNFMAGGGGTVTSAQVCRTVTNGVMAPLTLAASNYTSPVGIQYEVTVTDDVAGTTMSLGTAYISGATWDLDQWTPTNVTTLSYAGPSFISGALNASGAITAPAFHGTADTALTSQAWATLPASCPNGYSPSFQDIHGNFLNCNANSYQPSGTTPGMLAQSPAGSEMLALTGSYRFNIGSAASYSSFDANGILYSRGATFTGQSNLFRLNGNAWFADQVGFQNGMNDIAAASGGTLFVPDIFYPSTTITTTGTTYNNLTVRGYGPFTSNLSVTNATDYPLWDQTQGAFLSRANFDGMSFYGAHAAGGTHSCLTLFSDSSYFVNSVAQNCGNAGIEADSEFTHELMYGDYLLSNGGSGLYSNGTGNRGTNTQHTAPATDLTLLGNLNNFNGRYGYESDNTGYTQLGMIGSFGDHFESNSLGAFKFKWTNGTNIISPYIYGPQNMILGDQTSASHVAFGTLDGSLFDQAGFYNVALYNNCQNHLGGTSGGAPANGGACALRNKFPLIEDYLDTSEISDWDMSSGTASAWTAGANASIGKAVSLSQTTGEQWLAVSCSAAPCSATQTVTDKTGTGSHYFRTLYQTGDQSTNTVNFAEVIISNSSGTLVDSGALPSWGGPFLRNDQSWETTFQSSTTTYTITLQCDTTTVPCFFTDVRSVKNYVLNPGMELGGAGNAPTNWNFASSCSLETALVHTGTSAAHCAGNSIAATQVPGVTSGEYYLLSAWVYQTSGAQPVNVAYGTVNDGTFSNGFYTHQVVRGAPLEKGEWQKVSYIIQATNTNQPITFGGFLSGMDGYVDDVQVIHLHANKQSKRDDFNTVTVGGSPTLNGVQGSSATKLMGASGTFTPGHVLNVGSDGSAVDGGAGVNVINCGTTATCSANVLNSPKITVGNVQLSGTSVTVNIAAAGYSSTPYCFGNTTNMTEPVQINGTTNTGFSIITSSGAFVNWTCIGN